MKRVLFAVLTVLLIFPLAACGGRPEIHMGVNAEIVEIHPEGCGFTVRALDQDSVLGETCYVDCTDENLDYLYVNYNTQEVLHMEFDDFEVGDHITVDVQAVESGYTVTSRVQLLTQRI